jgi:hypothetical protein
MQLECIGLKFDVFENALKGWEKLNFKINSKPVFTIADLSQSSNLKRLYIIDVEKAIVLFNTYVAHGRNSGEEYAHSFSNESQSFKSSLGFYITGKPYQGKHGLSLLLKGIEKGINDKAEQRAIVMHGADYVSEAFINQSGRLGRSLGCPAISPQLTAPIIEQIKDGSCLFIYHPKYKPARS